MTRRRGGVKRRETDLASIQFPKCVLHSPEHPKRFTMLGRKEKGNEEIEVAWGDKRESKGGERNQASNHTPK